MFNDLMTELQKEGIDAFAYADDVAIHAIDIEKLGKAIKIVEDWVDKNKMKINRKKSGIIFHKKRRSKINIDTIMTYKEYPIVTKYKYLGIWLDVTMKFKEHLEYI